MTDVKLIKLKYDIFIIKLLIMRLEGLCPCRFPGKTDCHPKKLGPGWHNWWEVDMQHITPRSMRKQELKEEIKRQGY